MKINKCPCFLSLVSFLAIFLTVSCFWQGEKLPQVIRIIDGHIILLDTKESVRLLGVDAIPTYECLKLDEYAERLGKDKTFLMELGKKSAKFTEKLCKGKRVKLEYGQVKRDKYGRLLAFVYLPNGKLLNEEIILQGYGFVDPEYPVKPELINRFNQAQQKAIEEKRGLWGEGLEGFQE